MFAGKLTNFFFLCVINSYLVSLYNIKRMKYRQMNFNDTSTYLINDGYHKVYNIIIQRPV